MSKSRTGRTYECLHYSPKKLAADCNFGLSSDQPANPALLTLDVLLRDFFVCELRDDTYISSFLKEIRHSRCSRNSSSKQKVQKTTKPQKAVFRAVHKTSGFPARDVNKVATPRSPARNHYDSGKQPKHRNAQCCWRFDTQKSPDTHKFHTPSCNYCKKRGHIEKACIKKHKDTQNSHRNHNLELPPQHVQKVTPT